MLGRAVKSAAFGVRLVTLRKTTSVAVEHGLQLPVANYTGAIGEGQHAWLTLHVYTHS